MIRHISEGGTPPSAEYVKELQKRWQLFAEHKKVTKFENQLVMGEKCDVLKNEASGLFVAFKTDTNESYTGYKLHPLQSDRQETHGIIGRDYSLKSLDTCNMLGTAMTNSSSTNSSSNN